MEITLDCDCWLYVHRNTVELRYDPTTDDKRDGSEPQTTSKRSVAYWHIVVCDRYCVGLFRNKYSVVRRNSVMVVGR